MAVAANLSLLDWEEWTRQMLEKRRKRWMEKKVLIEVSDEEEDDWSSEEEEVTEAGETGEEEIAMRDAEETEEEGLDEEDGAIEADESVEVEEEEVEREVNESEEANEEEEVKNAEEGEEGENEVERDVNEDGEVDEEEELDEGEEEENEAERDINKDEDLDEDEVRTAEELEEEVDEVKWEVNEDEEEEVKKAEELEEEEDEVERDVNEDREVDETEVTDREEMKEEQGRNEYKTGVKEEEELEESGEEGESEDEVDVEEEEQDEDGKYHLAEQFRERMRRLEDENIQQNQESVKRELNEDDELSDSVESNDEDSEEEFYVSEKQQTDPEELEDPDIKTRRNYDSILGARTKDEGKNLIDEKESAAESWTPQELPTEEEESTDEEEGELSADDDEDEDVVKIYCKGDYCTDVFRTLTEFRDSSILTDLTLSTGDGRSLQVHSSVLAAVSSVIRERLSRSNVDNEITDSSVGDRRWSVSLGPEVDHVGLNAVVEFAYTGLISCLDKNTRHQIKAAAQSLGASRVLDLCKEEDATTTQKEEEQISAAEQMMTSLRSIRQLWTERVGCDVILDAVRGSFHAHRVILAVSSDYFRGMFTSGMRESQQPCVALPFLLASELEVLIGCSYSGTLSLSWKCVFEITTTALKLQYQPALLLCLKFLHQEINPDSCLDVASFAEAYELVNLLEVADDFVLRQFQKVACTSKFKDLPARKLLKYLNSRSLCVPSELVVFKAVVGWIQAKPKTRLRFTKELMKTVHFPLMTFKEFKEVQSLNMWSDHSLAELFEAVFEDFCSNEIQCRHYLPQENLVLIGGDQISENMGYRILSRGLWFGNSLRNHTGIKKSMEWRKLGEMPEPDRICHEVAVLNGQLYVFGGKKYYGIYDTLNSVYRYDSRQNIWECLVEMQEKRSSFSVVVLDQKIYAIGGYCDLDYIASVERYCPTGNSWSFTCPLDLPLCGHVAKVLQDQIFVSGGLTSDYQCLASMFVYHPETGSTYVANMSKPRARHCMETLDERLYVAGGISADDNMRTVDQLACEVYDPMTNSWTAFTSLPLPHVGAAGAVLEGKFYVLGGYSQEDYSDTKMAHRYDPTTQRWENMGRMPGPNSDIKAALLRLPPHLRL